MRPMRHPALCGPTLLLLALWGCGSVETYSVQLRPPGPPSEHRVETFPEGQRPAAPFFELALIQVVGHGTDANAQDVVNAMRFRASEFGCDAITRLRVDQGASMTHGYGVCIRYASPALMHPAPRTPGEPGAAPGSSPPDNSVPGSPAAPDSAPAEPDGTVKL